ncbi:MAG TPA: hypothetical protein PL041_04475 [Melioribacteraceae bacterium]|nr:hypothetical protein [Melioribacteraceae bacterium]
MRLFLFYVMLFFNASLLFANNNNSIDSSDVTAVDSSMAYVNDSVNVRDLLAKEIEVIKAKQLEEDKKLQTLVISETTEQQEGGLSILEYSFIVIEVFLVSAILVFYLKRRNTKKKVEIKKLKFNISKLREEKIVCGLTNDLTNVRRKLLTIPINYNDGGKDVIIKARQYEISKGEVYLAAKLKLLSGEIK